MWDQPAIRAGPVWSGVRRACGSVAIARYGSWGGFVAEVERAWVGRGGAGEDR